MYNPTFGLGIGIGIGIAIGMGNLGLVQLGNDISLIGRDHNLIFPYWDTCDLGILRNNIFFCFPPNCVHPGTYASGKTVAPA